MQKVRREALVSDSGCLPFERDLLDPSALDNRQENRGECFLGNFCAFVHFIQNSATLGFPKPGVEMNTKLDTLSTLRDA